MKKRLYEFKKDVIIILISAICVILSHFNVNVLGVDLAYIALILCGIPIIYGSIIGLIKEHDIKADVLVSIAIITSVYIGKIYAAEEIAGIMEFGGL